MEAAPDRQLWKDLLGRQVLQVGRQFMLLPMRHVPVEEAYDAPFRIVHVADDEHAASVVQVASDGSAIRTLGEVLLRLCWLRWRVPSPAKDSCLVARPTFRWRCEQQSGTQDGLATPKIHTRSVL